MKYFCEIAALCLKYNTVNVVIFAGGKFRENVGETFQLGVLFSRGGNFREKDKSAKNAKITPREISTFTVRCLFLIYIICVNLPGKMLRIQ